MFLEYKELIKTPEFWLETIQNDLYSEVKTFMTENNLTQTQLAEQLGVSKGYISQILKGKFNHTLKKLIEISLAIGKVPSIEFKSSKEWMRSKAEVKEYTYIEVIMTGSFNFNKDPLHIIPHRKTTSKQNSSALLPGRSFRNEIPCSELIPSFKN
jgi:transcriptional regulator with XRE-family HTH domain